MSDNAISIIIPVFNKWELTCACLTSLRDNPPNETFEVIVADNASTDATRDKLESFGRDLFGPAFTRIRNKENRNFSGACNQGARAARHGLLFFLNNDTLLTPGWSAPLVHALAKDRMLAAVGPLLLHEDNTVQHLGAAVFADRSIHHFYAGIPAAHPLARKRRRLSFITAAALLIGKADFFAAGAFHEGYINGLEDVELCCRLREAGRSLSVVSDSMVYHLEGATRNQTVAPPHNAPLLRQRCPAARTPDFHRIARDDGYEPYLGLFFETFLKPLPERLHSYAASGVLADKVALADVLEKEIFWLEGWRTLAALLEQAGDTASALAALVRCSHHYPTIEVMEDVLRLARHSGNARLAEEYAALLHMAAETLADAHFFRVRFRTIMDTARSLDDAGLEALAKGWRKAYGARMPETVS